ncbi:hypothetical protein IMSAGC019_03128 [Lachnospiraceae bacterium]|nr:hypothetical protein IMSAGC019_03128 [Lachnospiraceae bacterium]
MGLIKGLKKSGITKNTPRSLMLGAGTIYKNLHWDSEKDAWQGEIFGATSGGNSFKLTPNIVTIEVDGATVDTKGLTHKQGEMAELTINLVEINTGSLKLAMIGREVESEAEGFTKLATKSVIEDGDYIDNVAFVGFLVDDTPIIIIMENALCTSGLELSGKNKETTVIPATFKPYADFGEDASQDTLPVFIYYPDDSGSANAGGTEQGTEN